MRIQFLLGFSCLFARALPVPAYEPIPSKQNLPVVTLGSLAMTPAQGVCRAVGFPSDSRHVLVCTVAGWESWLIANGQKVSTTAHGMLNDNDQFVPISDGKNLLHVIRDGNTKEWQVVDIRTGLSVRTIRLESLSYGHSVSEDGRFIVTCGSKDSRLISTLAISPDTTITGICDVRRCSVSQDGKTFAVIADDRVTVFAGTAKWALELPKDTVYCSLAVSPDGSMLATASALETDNGKRPGPVELWDIKERKRLRVLEKVEWFAEQPHRMRFAPDGRTVFAGDGAFLRGWNIATGAKVFSVEPGWGWIGNIQISPDGKHIAVAFPNRPMVWEVETGKQPDALLGHSGTVWDIAISPDGKRAATAMYGRPTVYLWDTTTGKNVGELNAAFAIPEDSGRTVPGRVRIQFSHDGGQLLTNNEASGANGPIRIWDANTRGVLREIPVKGRDGAFASFTRQGLFAVLDRKPTLVDVPTGKTLWEKPAIPRTAIPIISRLGDRVAVETRKDSAVWNAADGTEIDTPPGEPIAFGQDSSGLILQGKKDLARFRDLTNRKDGATIGHDAKSSYLAASPTGLIAAFHQGDTQNSYRIYRAATGQLIRSWDERRPPMAGQFGIDLDDRPTLGLFSDDGRTFAAFQQSMRVFETYSGIEFLEVPYRGTMRASTFHPDGKTLWTSHGFATEEDATGSTQVLGWDMTGGAWEPQAIAKLEELERLKLAMNGSPVVARNAMYRLATRPAEAIAFAKEATKLPTKTDSEQYETWLKELDAPAFAIREFATKGLAKAGWRVEGAMNLLLATTDSVEVRQRLERLLEKRDMRPLRAIQLLEVIGSPEAIEVLKEIATGNSASLVVQDATWTLQRLGK